MSERWYTFSVLILTLVLAAAPAAATRFASVMSDADWQVHASVFECKMSHPIRAFGEAVFLQRAGEQQSFYLRQQNRYLSEGEAELTAHHPLWREMPVREDLGQVEVSLGERPVRLGWQESQRLITHLHGGKRLFFSRSSWANDDERMQVVVEPISFRPALNAYQDCLADLLPVNYDQIARTALYFSSGSDELRDSELRKLRHLTQYAKADDRITEIYVDGHTDAVGLRADNLDFAQRRAEAVGQYLIDNGVAEDKVKVRWHGERYPVASNDSPAGRSENRRVTIRVDREDERLGALSSSLR